MNFNIIFEDKNSKNINNILKNNIFLNKEIYYENINLKKNIDLIPSYIWKIIRSITTDYEYIGNNRIHDIKELKEINSISRAYFKLLEILNMNEYRFNLKSKKELSISCLCEAPGGFVKCLYDYRNNKNDKYKTISLKDDKDNLIEWDINNLKNIEIIHGDKNKNHDGNIFNPDIIKYYIDKHKEKVDIVTADGGMRLNDLEENYKSIYHMQLFLSELYIAMKILKIDGIFILKIYELSSKVMVDFIIMLNNIFKKVNIVKPKTSREMNNEKYIICHFLKNDQNKIKNIGDKILKILEQMWVNKNLLLLNILNNDEIDNNKNLIKLFDKIDYINLNIQYNKLIYALSLKNMNIKQLKYILYNERKKTHYYNAYKWIRYNIN